MNYYIRGDRSRAKEIKAAFEANGINTDAYNFTNPCNFYFNVSNKVYIIEYEIRHIITGRHDYSQLELSIEPQFKVGDWIVPKSYNGEMPRQIVKKLDTVFVLDDGTAYICEDAQKFYRLWTIKDAKDGDILITENGNPFIFCGNKVYDRSHDIIAYGGLSTTGEFYESYREDCWTYNISLKPATKEQRDLLFAKMKEAGYEWDADKKELRKIIKPMFKVGDWLWHKERGVFPVLIAGYDEEKGYLVKYLDSESYFGRDATENEYRLWEISDARNGDVLVLNGSSKEYKWIGIFKAHTSDTSFSSHCHYNCGMCEFVTHIARCTQHDTEYNDIRPATNEERNILFAKMKEAGYQWDDEKKELKKLPKHYDISNFSAGMPVLVRETSLNTWQYVLFSHCYTGGDGLTHFNAGLVGFNQCIPFNKDTKHLLGTTDMCDEQYINW